MRNKKLILILFSVVLAAAVIVSLFLWKPWDGSSEIDTATTGYYQSTIGRGNLPGNDLVAEEGDWIYYRNAGGDGNIYRISKDGTQSEFIVGDTGYPELRDINLQIWNGWLYYHNYKNKCISRVRLDGSIKEDISMMFVNTPVDISRATIIINDTIYGRDVLNGGLYKSDIKDNKLQLLTTDDVLSFDIKNEHIYYVLYSSLQSDSPDIGIYKMKLDGTNKEKLSDNYSVSHFLTNGNYMYFVSGIDNKPYSINIITNEILKILDEKVWGLCVVDDWIYYTLSSSLCGENIYRMRMDGSEQSLVFSETGITGIEYAAGWLYYLKREEGDSDFGFDDKLYRVRADGTNPQMVTF